MVQVRRRYGMQCGIVIALLAATTTPAAAQTDSGSEVQQLRRRIAELEGRLQGVTAELQAAASQARRNVTEIGTRPQSYEPRQVIRIYDVGDLFVLAPTYEARVQSDLAQVSGPIFAELAGGSDVRQQAMISGGGGLGGGGLGGGQLDVPNANRRLPDKAGILRQAGVGLGGGGLGGGGGGLGGSVDIRTDLDGLIDTIKETIAPDSWDDVGGPNTATTMGSLLIVSATEDVHLLIDDLLGLLRQRWGGLRTVSVRAYWVWLDDEDLAKLLEEAAQQEDAFQGALNPAQWADLLDDLKDDEEARGGYRAALTCYNGQTVYAVSGGQSLAVTGVRPLVGQETVGYEPATSVLHEGVALQVTPRVTTSGKYVVLDLHSRVSHVQQFEPAPAPRDGGPVSVDRVRQATQRLATTLRIPTGRPVLVGGMTFEGEHDAAEQTLYLVVDAAVQELKEEPAETVKEIEEAKPEDDAEEPR